MKIAQKAAQICHRQNLGLLGLLMSQGPSSENDQANAHLGPKSFHMIFQSWKVGAQILHTHILNAYILHISCESRGNFLQNRRKPEYDLFWLVREGQTKFYGHTIKTFF